MNNFEKKDKIGLFLLSILIYFRSSSMGVNDFQQNNKLCHIHFLFSDDSNVRD